MWIKYLSGENPGRVDMARIRKVEADRPTLADPWRIFLHLDDGSLLGLPGEFTTPEAAEVKIDDFLLNGS